MLSLEVAQFIDARVKDWLTMNAAWVGCVLDEMEKGWTWSGRRREVDGGGRRDGEKGRSQKPERQRQQKPGVVETRHAERSLAQSAVTATLNGACASAS